MSGIDGKSSNVLGGSINRNRLAGSCDLQVDAAWAKRCNLLLNRSPVTGCGDRWIDGDEGQLVAVAACAAGMPLEELEEWWPVHTLITPPVACAGPLVVCKIAV